MREPQPQSDRKYRDPLDPGGFGYARLFSSRQGIPELDRSAFQPRVCSIDNPSTGDLAIAARIFGVSLSPLALWEIQRFCAGAHDISLGGFLEMSDGPVGLSYTTNRSTVRGNSSPSIQFEINQRDWYQRPLAQMVIHGVPHRGAFRPEVHFCFSRDYTDGWQDVERLFRAFSHGLVRQNLLAHEPAFVRGPYAPIWFTSNDSKVTVRAERVTQSSHVGDLFQLHPSIFPLAVGGRGAPSIDERVRLVTNRLEEKFGISAVRVPREVESNDPVEFLAKVARSKQDHPWIYSGKSYGIGEIGRSLVCFSLTAPPEENIKLIRHVHTIEHQLVRSARERSSFNIMCMDVEIESVKELTQVFASTGARGLRTPRSLDNFHVLLNDFILTQSQDPLKDLAEVSKNIFDSLCRRTRDVSVEGKLSLSQDGVFRKSVQVSVNAPQSTACNLEFTAGSPLHCAITPKGNSVILNPPLVTKVGEAFEAPRIPTKLQKMYRDESDPSRSWLIANKLSINTAPKILWSGNLPR